MQKKILFIMITVMFVLTACSPAAAPTEQIKEKPTKEMMEAPADHSSGTQTDAMGETATDEMSTSDMKSPAFFNVSLTNVNTGEAFKISDYSGKVVVVENLAMWCSNCKKQQDQVKLFNEAMGMRTDLILVGFDVDTNENPADLKKYTDSYGFNWVYAVIPQDVVNEISQLLGDNFINPPSTPIFVIDRKGTMHPMPFGIKSADDLQKFVEPFLSEGM